MRVILITIFLHLLSLNVRGQYIEHICPGALVSLDEENAEKSLQQMMACLTTVENVEDSLLLELNKTRPLNELGRGEEADKIIANAEHPMFDKYKKAKCLLLERKARFNMMRDKNLNLKYWLQVDSIAVAIDFKSAKFRAKASIANSYYTLFKDIGSAYEYYMEALKLEDMSDGYYLSVLNGAYDTSFKTAGNSTDSIAALGFDYIDKKLLGEISTNDSSFIATFYGIIAGSLLTNGELRSALEHNIKAVAFKPKAKKYQYGLTRHYFNIARIFQSLSNYDKVYEYILKIEEISEKFNYKSLALEIAVLRGSTYLKQGHYEKSKSEYLKFIELSKSSKVLQKTLLTTAYADLAYVLILQDSLVKANEYMSKGNATLPITKEGVSHMKMHSVMSNYHLKTKEFIKARSDANVLLKLAKKFNDVNYENIAYQYLAESNYALGQYKPAYQFSESSKTLSDSIFRAEQNYLVHDLEAKYQKQEQDLKIGSLQTKDLLNQERLNAQRKTIIIGGIGFGLISILSFFLFRQGRKIRNQNEIINKSLSEKELLLKEIHHRVKNNLQVVSSLLSLQSEYIKDDSALSAINEGRNRVKSMALIHQNLYQHDNLTTIDAKDYFNKLISGLFNSYNISDDKIKLNLKIDPIRIDVDTLVPLGLIVNELVSNALKYAFPNQQQGSILVKLTNNKLSQLTLLVQDNGIGFDPKIINDDISSFGYQMIQAFCEKLEAKLDIESDSKATAIKVIIET